MNGLQKKISRILLAALVACCTSAAVFAQQMEQIRNVAYKIQYQVPVNWLHVKQANDSITIATYASPEENMFLMVGKLKKSDTVLTPEQALKDLLTEFGVIENKIFATRYNRINFLETTGKGIKEGELIQYDAMSAEHQGNIILVYIYGTTKAYQGNRQLMERIVHSLAPYKGRN